MKPERIGEIREALLRVRDLISVEELFPTIVPEAAEFIHANPYAFAIATCLDRGTKAEIIWNIPYDIRNVLGHLDPFQIYQMSLDDLAGLFTRLPRRPRYVNAAPSTVRSLTRIVVEECGGDAEKIWIGKRASEVKRTFGSVYGVGEGISNMAVLLIEKAYNIRFDVQDRIRMDIKADVHTKRVLYRLGVSEAETEESATEASQLLNPPYPGDIDGALWSIGRKFCFANNPNCWYCPMTDLCERKIR
jgi:endonuclease III